jgi:CHASE1-domain containing sensor protein
MAIEMNWMRPANLGLAVALVGLMGSVALTRHLADAAAHVEAARFTQAAHSLTESLSRRIDVYTEIAFGLRSLFHVNPALDRRAFIDSVARLGLGQRHAEIKNIAFTRYVRAQDKAPFERHVREDTSVEPQGYPDFRIHPPGERDEYFVADYLWPMAGNAGIHGLESRQPANLASMRTSQHHGAQPAVL